MDITRTEPMLTSLPSNVMRTTRNCVYLVTPVNAGFCSCDLDLDPMTLTYKFWPRYSEDVCTCNPKIKFVGQSFRKLQPEQARHIDTQRERETHTQTDTTESIYHPAIVGDYNACKSNAEPLS